MRTRRKRCCHRVLLAEQLEPRQLLTGWNLDAIDAPDVWGLGYQGQGVTVAVIDSGIDVHADLLPNVWVNPAEKLNGRDDDGNGYIDDLNGWNFVDNNNNPIGTHNHGTHVSGTIAAENNDFGTTGIAYRSKIMPLRVFDEAGFGKTSDIADAIRYAVKNGADIINLSVGGIATRSLNLALEYAAKENVLVVAASGNESALEPVFPAIHSAKWPHIISVGAHDYNFQLLPTSNKVGRSGAVQVDAPGIGISSTISKNQFGNKGGTSSAAAHVAGVAALMVSANDRLTAAELRRALIDSATKKVAGSDSVGAVNALRAVNLVAGTTRKPQGITRDADFNNNGEVDFRDFVKLAQNYGTSSADHQNGDADGDGSVGFGDFLILVQSYGNVVPQHARRENGVVQASSSQSPANATDTTANSPASVTPRPIPIPANRFPSPATTGGSAELVRQDEEPKPKPNVTSVLNSTSTPQQTSSSSRQDAAVVPTPKVSSGNANTAAVDAAVIEVADEGSIWDPGRLILGLLSL